MNYNNYLEESLAFVDGEIKKMRDIQMSRMFRKCGVKDCEEYAIDEMELDVPGNHVSLCEGHLIARDKFEAGEENKATGN